MQNKSKSLKSQSSSGMLQKQQKKLTDKQKSIEDLSESYKPICNQNIKQNKQLFAPKTPQNLSKSFHSNQLKSSNKDKGGKSREKQVEKNFIQLNVQKSQNIFRTVDHLDQYKYQNINSEEQFNLINHHVDNQQVSVFKCKQENLIDKQSNLIFNFNKKQSKESSKKRIIQNVKDASNNILNELEINIQKQINLRKKKISSFKTQANVNKKEISDSLIKLSIDEDQDMLIENNDCLSDKNSTFIINEDLINQQPLSSLIFPNKNNNFYKTNQDHFDVQISNFKFNQCPSAQNMKQSQQSIAFKSDGDSSCIVHEDFSPNDHSNQQIDELFDSKLNEENRKSKIQDSQREISKVGMSTKMNALPFSVSSQNQNSCRVNTKSMLQQKYPIKIENFNTLEILTLQNEDFQINNHQFFINGPRSARINNVQSKNQRILDEINGLESKSSLQQIDNNNCNNQNDKLICEKIFFPPNFKNKINIEKSNKKLEQNKVIVLHTENSLLNNNQEIILIENQSLNTINSHSQYSQNDKKTQETIYIENLNFKIEKIKQNNNRFSVKPLQKILNSPGLPSDEKKDVIQINLYEEIKDCKNKKDSSEIQQSESNIKQDIHISSNQTHFDDQQFSHNFTSIRQIFQNHRTKNLQYLQRKTDSKSKIISDKYLQTKDDFSNDKSKLLKSKSQISQKSHLNLDINQKLSGIKQKKNVIVQQKQINLNFHQKKNMPQKKQNQSKNNLNLLQTQNNQQLNNELNEQNNKQNKIETISNQQQIETIIYENNIENYQDVQNCESLKKQFNQNKIQKRHKSNNQKLSDKQKQKKIEQQLPYNELTQIKNQIESIEKPTSDEYTKSQIELAQYCCIQEAGANISSNTNIQQKSNNSQFSNIRKELKFPQIQMDLAMQSQDSQSQIFTMSSKEIDNQIESSKLNEEKNNEFVYNFLQNNQNDNQSNAVIQQHFQRYFNEIESHSNSMIDPRLLSKQTTTPDALHQNVSQIMPESIGSPIVYKANSNQISIHKPPSVPQPNKQKKDINLQNREIGQNSFQIQFPGISNYNTELYQDILQQQLNNQNFSESKLVLKFYAGQEISKNNRNNLKNNLKSEKNGVTSNTTFSRSIPNEMQSSTGIFEIGEGTNYKDKNIEFQNDIHFSSNQLYLDKLNFKQMQVNKQDNFKQSDEQSSQNNGHKGTEIEDICEQISALKTNRKPDQNSTKKQIYEQESIDDHQNLITNEDEFRKSSLYKQKQYSETIINTCDNENNLINIYDEDAIETPASFIINEENEKGQEQQINDQKIYDKKILNHQDYLFQNEVDNYHYISNDQDHLQFQTDQLRFQNIKDDIEKPQFVQFVNGSLQFQNHEICQNDSNCSCICSNYCKNDLQSLNQIIAPTNHRKNQSSMYFIYGPGGGPHSSTMLLDPNSQSYNSLHQQNICCELHHQEMCNQIQNLRYQQYKYGMNVGCEVDHPHTLQEYNNNYSSQSQQPQLNNFIKDKHMPQCNCQNGQQLILNQKLNKNFVHIQNRCIPGFLPSKGNHKNMLENSCVTFQYYNSSKFASNSTVSINNDRNNLNMNNCFYLTKTTNKTNQTSTTDKNHSIEDCNQVNGSIEQFNINGEDFGLSQICLFNQITNQALKVGKNNETFLKQHQFKKNNMSLEGINEVSLNNYTSEKMYPVGCQQNQVFIEKNQDGYSENLNESCCDSKNEIVVHNNQLNYFQQNQDDFQDQIKKIQIQNYEDRNRQKPSHILLQDFIMIQNQNQYKEYTDLQQIRDFACTEFQNMINYGNPDQTQEQEIIIDQNHFNEDQFQDQNDAFNIQYQKKLNCPSIIQEISSKDEQSRDSNTKIDQSKDDNTCSVNSKSVNENYNNSSKNYSCKTDNINNVTPVNIDYQSQFNLNEEISRRVSQIEYEFQDKIAQDQKHNDFNTQQQSVCKQIWFNSSKELKNLESQRLIINDMDKYVYKTKQEKLKGDIKERQQNNMLQNHQLFKNQLVSENIIDKNLKLNQHEKSQSSVIEKKSIHNLPQNLNSQLYFQDREERITGVPTPTIKNILYPQRMSCSLAGGSSPMHTNTESQDQSYTIVQMASISAQKNPIFQSDGLNKQAILMNTNSSQSETQRGLNTNSKEFSQNIQEHINTTISDLLRIKQNNFQFDQQNNIKNSNNEQNKIQNYFGEYVDQNIQSKENMEKMQLNEFQNTNDSLIQKSQCVDEENNCLQQSQSNEQTLICNQDIQKQQKDNSKNINLPQNEINYIQNQQSNEQNNNMKEQIFLKKQNLNTDLLESLFNNLNQLNAICNSDEIIKEEQLSIKQKPIQNQKDQNLINQYKANLQSDSQINIPQILKNSQNIQKPLIQSKSFTCNKNIQEQNSENCDHINIQSKIDSLSQKIKDITSINTQIRNCEKNEESKNIDHIYNLTCESQYNKNKNKSEIVFEKQIPENISLFQQTIEQISYEDELEDFKSQERMIIEQMNADNSRITNQDISQFSKLNDLYGQQQKQTNSKSFSNNSNILLISNNRNISARNQDKILEVQLNQQETSSQASNAQNASRKSGQTSKWQKQFRSRSRSGLKSQLSQENPNSQKSFCQVQKTPTSANQAIFQNICQSENGKSEQIKQDKIKIPNSQINTIQLKNLKLSNNESQSQRLIDTDNQKQIKKKDTKINQNKYPSETKNSFQQIQGLQKKQGCQTNVQSPFVKEHISQTTKTQSNLISPQEFKDDELSTQSKKQSAQLSISKVQILPQIQSKKTSTSQSKKSGQVSDKNEQQKKNKINRQKKQITKIEEPQILNFENNNEQEIEIHNESIFDNNNVKLRNQKFSPAV